MSIYLDCNATTPVEPEVLDVVLRFMRDEYGNAGSRTHEFGVRAKRAVESARAAIASIVEARPEEIVFTSGATESNNLAILGIARAGISSGRKHIVSTTIEHKAVLEPLSALSALHGFDITLVPVSPSGAVDPDRIEAAIRHDTILVSVMHVNNETGVIQPISEIADRLAKKSAFMHVDAAQGFGKLLPDLQHPGIDLISVSGHKIYGPKGVGALILKANRGVNRVITPLMYGGGQERGLRPGTLPVPLVAGLGKATELASKNWQERRDKCFKFRANAVNAMKRIGAQFNGDQDLTIPTTINVSLPGVDSEAAMLVVKDLISISNGSACTSTSYSPSHVLVAMNCSQEQIDTTLRVSWSHLTSEPDWDRVCERLKSAQLK